MIYMTAHNLSWCKRSSLLEDARLKVHKTLQWDSAKYHFIQPICILRKGRGRSLLKYSLSKRNWDVEEGGNIAEQNPFTHKKGCGES